MPIIIKKKVAAPAPDPVVVPKPSVSDRMNAVPLGKANPNMPFADGQYLLVRKEHPNSVVAWWLMASYLYYIHDCPLLSDGLYDEMAQDMIARWDEIRHPHKHLITPEHLATGSLHSLAAKDYPLVVRAAAKQVVGRAWGLQIDFEHA